MPNRKSLFAIGIALFCIATLALQCLTSCKSTMPYDMEQPFKYDGTFINGELIPGIPTHEITFGVGFILHSFDGHRPSQTFYGKWADYDTFKVDSIIQHGPESSYRDTQYNKTRYINWAPGELEFLEHEKAADDIHIVKLKTTVLLRQSNQLRYGQTE